MSLASAGLPGRSVSRPASALPWVTLLLALAVGVVSLRYLLPVVPFAAPLPNAMLQPTWLVTHIGASSLALIVGAAQFLIPRRGRALRLHRWLGRSYVAAVLVGAGSALVLAPQVATGAVAGLGFGLLAVTWLAATGMALALILRREVTRHRSWMLRSYALAAAAITLRLYLPLANAADIPFELSYPVIAWLCWVPNLLAMEVWLRAQGSGIGLPAAARA